MYEIESRNELNIRFNCTYLAILRDLYSFSHVDASPVAYSHSSRFALGTSAATEQTLLQACVEEAGIGCILLMVTAQLVPKACPCLRGAQHILQLMQVLV